MEFYFVLLLVAAVSADSDYYQVVPQVQVVPQTYTVQSPQIPTIPTIYQQVPTFYQQVQKPVQAVHTPIHTPVVKTLETTDIFNPFQKPVHIQAVQTPTLYHQVPTVFKTVQTPTFYKVDDDKVYKIDGDKVYKVDDDKVYRDDDDKIYKIDDDKVHKVDDADKDSKIVYRVARSADNEDYYISNDDNTHIYKIDDDAVSSLEVDDDIIPFSHISHFRTIRSADNIEVKKTNSHFLNLLTNKPKTTQVIARTSQNVFTHTPVNNVATTLIHNTKPVDNVHVVAPRVLVNPTFKTSDIKIVNPVQNPLIKTFNTPAFRTIVQNPVVKTLETTDIINPVQQSVQIQTVQTPVFRTLETTDIINPIQKSYQIQTPVQAVQTPVFRTLETRDIINPIQKSFQIQTPVQAVQTPVFRTLETTDIINPVQKPVQIHTVQTPTLYTTINNPVQLVNQPIFRSVETPVVRRVIQTPVEITPGYVAATHGNVHTAPLPEGPSNDGFFASHHINLPNVKA